MKFSPQPFLCDICGRGFTTKGLCSSHQKTHSGQDNRRFPCQVCRKLFVSKSYLKTHLNIHTGEKPFICEVCGKGFLTRRDLEIHSTMHTGEKSFICETCGKAFARRDALRCHRRFAVFLPLAVFIIFFLDHIPGNVRISATIAGKVFPNLRL